MADIPPDAQAGILAGGPPTMPAPPPPDAAPDAPAPLAAITRTAPMGMITLRGAADDPAVAAALQAAAGLAVPGQRRIAAEGARSVAWMSPDEFLLMLPPDGVAAALEAGRQAAGDGFVTLADVSAARIAFRIHGPRADEVVMKLCPVDIARLPKGEIRRTRAAQIACALWRSGEGGITLLCFRSVANHAQALLENAARPGSAVFPEPSES